MIKKTTKQHRIKGNHFFTIAFQSNPTKQAKKIRIPKLIFAPIGLVLAGIIGVGAFAGDYIQQLENTVAAKNEQIIQLSQESYSKDLAVSQTKAELLNMKTREYDRINELEQLTAGLSLQVEDLEQYKTQVEQLKDKIQRNMDVAIDYKAKPNEEKHNSTLVAAKKQNQTESDRHRLLATAPLILPDADDNIFVGNYIGGKIQEMHSELALDIRSNGQKSQEFEQLIQELEGIVEISDYYPSIPPIRNTYITSHFGYRPNPFTGRGREFHTGVDFKANYEPIVATADGTVEEAKRIPGYGNSILIDHGNGIKTRYAHNSEHYVAVGDQVKRGDIICKSGNTGRSTGPHLHYEVILNGLPQNPLDYILEEMD